jgi:hypothetical protein
VKYLVTPEHERGGSQVAQVLLRTLRTPLLWLLVAALAGLMLLALERTGPVAGPALTNSSSKSDTKSDAKNKDSNTNSRDKKAKDRDDDENTCDAHENDDKPKSCVISHG